MTRKGHIISISGTRTAGQVLTGLASAAAVIVLLLAPGPAGAQDAVVTTGDLLRGSTSDQAPEAAPTAPPAAAKPAVKKKKPVKQVPEETAGKPSDPATKTKTAAKGPSSGALASENSIVALVNDEPITGFELRQRASMLSGGTVAAKAQENFKAMIKAPGTSEKLKTILNDTIKANQGKSKDEIIAIFERRKKEFAMSMQRQAVENAKASALPAMKKQALEELVDEKLKLQEAKRLNVSVDEAEIDRVIASIAERNKMSMEQFTQQLGGSLEPMKNRIRSTMSWNDVIRRRFGPQISVATKDVDRFVATAAAGGEDGVELDVQRIIITMPAKLDQAGVAQRVSAADGIRAKFKDCKSAKGIISGVAGARFEELGKRKPSAFPEPTRSLLLNARDGEMLPPSVGEAGVELWTVCGRTVIKAEEQKRTEAEGELKQKEFELLAKRHLKDLRQDAHIEYR
jgi:peptidyl-prolyl cis-trans isomerase SurA